MTHNAKTIEELFTNAASLRISQKQRGDERYIRDGGYWDGGRCERGAAHNLKEDCQTLARFFDGITELKNAKIKLTTFNNQEEFENNKQSLLTKVNQAINGLQMKTGASSSVGGVCIIWDDFASYLDMIIDDFRREVEALKSDIERVAYSEAKELQKLNQEERKLQKEIEENERKAKSETDPEKKKKFILLATEAKNKWKKVLEKKKRLKSAGLGDNFNPDKHITDFIQAIKDKLDNKPPKQRKPTTDPNGTDPSGGSGTRKSDPLDPFQTNPNSNPSQNLLQNKQLIIIAGIALLIFLYFYSQPSKSKAENYYYDF